MKKGQLSFLLFYVFTYPLRWLSFKQIHALGRVCGTLLYHLSSKFRKRTLSNLALATSLRLENDEIPPQAKRSLQNLMITCLEYIKLDSTKDISTIVTCLNPQKAEELIKQGTPPIFFCGHQANWELLFLEGSSRMPGVAIGRPIKNEALYDFVLRVREKFGGRIIAPRQAVKEGLRALKNGLFLGVVGDQGMPDSGFSSPFLGRNAWTSPLPALLAYRTGCPLIVATTTRKEGRYEITYSDPIFPSKEKSADEEIPRLMHTCLAILEKTIEKHPDEWLFSHNRWKQQLPGKLKKAFRHESLLILLPQHTPHNLQESLDLIRKLYPHEFITLYTPSDKYHLENAEIITYTDPKELFIQDYRFKLIFNFTPYKELERHFKQQSAFTVLTQSQNLKPEQLTQGTDAS